MAAMKSCPIAWNTLVLAAMLCAASGCGLLKGSSSPFDPPQPMGQLATRRTGDNERALRMGRDVLREKGLLDKYDVKTATAYNKGNNKWEVCFTPKSGFAKRLRKRCFTFDF
jgi:hypothetical protein